MVIGKHRFSSARNREVVFLAPRGDDLGTASEESVDDLAAEETSSTGHDYPTSRPERCSTCGWHDEDPTVGSRHMGPVTFVATGRSVGRSDVCGQAVRSASFCENAFCSSLGGTVCIIISFVMSPVTLIWPDMNACIAAAWSFWTNSALAVS